jgi:hypothetical protein
MQRAKLFAYVNNNIQITWKMIYICKVYSAGQTVPSTAQIRAEGNNTKCDGKKRFNGSVTHRLRIMQCIAVIIQLVSQDHVCRFENESKMVK